MSLSAGLPPPKKAKVEEDLSEGDAVTILDVLVKAAGSMEEASADVGRSRSSSSWRAATEGIVAEVPPSEGTASASSAVASAARGAEPKAAPLGAQPQPKLAPWMATPVPPAPTGVPHPKLAACSPPTVFPSRAARPPEPLVPPKGAMRPPEPLVPPKMAAGPPAPPKVPPPTATRDGARMKAAAPDPVAPKYSPLDD